MQAVKSFELLELLNPVKVNLPYIAVLCHQLLLCDMLVEELEENVRMVHYLSQARYVL